MKGHRCKVSSTFHINRALWTRFLMWYFCFATSAPVSHAIYPLVALTWCFAVCPSLLISVEKFFQHSWGYFWKRPSMKPDPVNFIARLIIEKGNQTEKKQSFKTFILFLQLWAGCVYSTWSRRPEMGTNCHQHAADCRTGPTCSMGAAGTGPQAQPLGTVQQCRVLLHVFICCQIYTYYIFVSS